MDRTIFTSNVQKALEWVNEIEQLAGLESQAYALAALRAVLHELRDHLPVIEAAHLSAQLPLIIRGIYFEGWQPNHVPIKQRNREQFLYNIQENINQYARSTFDEEDVEDITKAVLNTFFTRIDKNEVAKLCSILPSSISNFLEETILSQ